MSAASGGRDAGIVPFALKAVDERSMSGTCRELETLLREAGLRPTRQRIALATILFAKGNRHLTAEMLHREANDAEEFVSLSTIYNTLSQFAEAGLLRRIAVDRGIKYSTPIPRTIIISWRRAERCSATFRIPT